VRVYAGFLFSPIIVTTATCILSGGAGVLLFVPMLVFTYAFTLVVAVPVFFLFRKLKWLQWWHAAAVGSLVGAIFAWLFVSGGNPYHFEIYGYGQELEFLAIGFFVGAVFWVMSVMGNEAFPYVPSRFPNSLLIAAVLLLTATLLFPYAYKVSDTRGEITAVLPALQGKPMLQVKLETGTSVAARSYCYGQYLPGRRVLVTHREKFLFVTEGYWVYGLADTKSAEEVLNECDDKNMSSMGRL
jgi:hypothetical protein